MEGECFISKPEPEKPVKRWEPEYKNLHVHATPPRKDAYAPCKGHVNVQIVPKPKPYKPPFVDLDSVKIIAVFVLLAILSGLIVSGLGMVYAYFREYEGSEFWDVVVQCALFGAIFSPLVYLAIYLLLLLMSRVFGRGLRRLIVGVVRSLRRGLKYLHGRIVAFEEATRPE